MKCIQTTPCTCSFFVILFVLLFPHAVISSDLPCPISRICYSVRSFFLMLLWPFSNTDTSLFPSCSVLRFLNTFLIPAVVIFDRDISGCMLLKEVPYISFPSVTLLTANGGDFSHLTLPLRHFPKIPSFFLKLRSLSVPDCIFHSMELIVRKRCLGHTLEASASGYVLHH